MEVNRTRREELETYIILALDILSFLLLIDFIYLVIQICVSVFSGTITESLKIAILFFYVLAFWFFELWTILGLVNKEDWGEVGKTGLEGIIMILILFVLGRINIKFAIIGFIMLAILLLSEKSEK